MIYEWKQHGYKVDPNIAIEEFERIAAHNNGGLTPAAVVKESQAEDAILHNEFEWDDSVAGPLHRESQARHMLRMIVVVQNEEEADDQPPIRAFVNVVRSVGTPEREKVYVRLESALADPELREQVLGEALRELRSWQAKYRAYSELATIWRAADDVQTSLKAAKDKLAAQ